MFTPFSLVIAAAAFLTSALTLFSGFGLGTLLMPVMAIFFPVSEAIALTAVVHLLNNLFKLYLLGRFAETKVVLRFGIPAMGAAFLGALLLKELSTSGAWITYSIGTRWFHIVPAKVVIGLVMLGFVFWEISPKAKTLTLSPRFLPLGGIVSGFFGGLSGHQGAFRSAFLLQCGLTKDGFLGTGVVLACIVDLARLPVYGAGENKEVLIKHWLPLLIATVSACFGAFLAHRAGKVATMEGVRSVTAVLLLMISGGLISGLI